MKNKKEDRKKPDNNTIKIVFNKEKIMEQAKNMRFEKNASDNGTGPLIAFKEYYQNKYDYLYFNFPDLFEIIYENPDNHDSLEMLKKMLAAAEMVHTNQISHKKASTVVGTVLKKEFYDKKLEEKNKDKH